MTLLATKIHAPVGKVGCSATSLSRANQGRAAAWLFRLQATSSEKLASGDNTPAISLGTAQLPADIDLKKLDGYLFQWANSVTQSANLPLPLPLKVDKLDNGVRLGYIRVVNGEVEPIVNIDVTLTPASGDETAMFRAVRSGPLKGQAPPGEPTLMQSMLAALKKAVPLSRG
eukprot:SM000001S04778  [mRNA]  locus=s1:2121521:2122741:- [translate_table: standard]